MIVLLWAIPVRKENTRNSLRNELKGFQKLFVFVEFFGVILKIDDVSAFVLFNFSENHVNIKIGSVLDFGSDGHVGDWGPRLEKVAQKLYEILFVKLVLIREVN